MNSHITRRRFIKGLAAGMALSALPVVAQEPADYVVCPILMYHYISTAPDNANSTLVDLTVPPDLFAQHLDTILELGFTTITMRQLWAGLSGVAPLPEKPLVLTFDDGYWDAHAHAAPLMLSRGMTGTVFVVSRFVGQASYLQWGDARALNAAGIEIGCHTATHANLSLFGRDVQEAEIKEATEAIEANIGVRPTSFCYPFGRLNNLTPRILEEYGYHTAVTTSDAVVQYHSNPYRMGRVRVRNRTSVNSLFWLINRQI